MRRRHDEEMLRRLVALDPVLGRQGEARWSADEGRRGEVGGPDASGPGASGPDASGPGDGDPDDGVVARAPARRRAPAAAATGALVLVVAVALGAGGRLALGSPQPEVVAAATAMPVGTSGPATSPVAGAAAGTRTPAPGTAPTPSGTGVVVHVVGQVRRPGLVTLAPGRRIADAVSAAGGAGRHADLAALNLARPLVDGEQIVVPTPGQPPPVSDPDGAGAGEPGRPVDLNRADATALDALPGVGPVMARRIVDHRTRNGPFRSVDELAEVPGIGERTLERLKPLVRV